MDKTFVYDTLVRQAKINNHLTNWNNGAFKKSLSVRGFWTEAGANIVVATRQCGKTTGLISYASLHLAPTGDVLAVVPYSTMGHAYQEAGYQYIALKKDNTPLADFLRGRPINQTHLLVDEFMLLSEKRISELLSHQWKSVSMVSTFISR